MRKLRQSIDSGVKGVHRSKAGKFNAKIIEFEDGTKAVAKERLHSNDLFRAVPKDQMHVREAFFYKFDRFCGFGVTPETIWMSLEGRPASIQRFVYGREAKDIVPGIFNRSKADWKFRVTKLAAAMDAGDARKIVLLDLMVNNTDRHARNFLVTDTQKVWAIDNGMICAPFLRYYRSVIHKYIFRFKFQFTPDLRAAVEKVAGSSLAKFSKYGVDLAMVRRRAEFILKHSDDLSFKALARGNYGKNDFPSYRKELLEDDGRSFPVVIEARHVPALLEYS